MQFNFRNSALRVRTGLRRRQLGMARKAVLAFSAMIVASRSTEQVSMG